MKLTGKPAIVVLTAAAYVALFELNSLLFSSLSFSASADWIYLPSGDTATLAVAGLISGLSPLLARKICVDRFALDATLKNLTAQQLFKTAAIFALLNATIHQLWLTFRGRTDHFLSSAMATVVGDFLGTILVLYAAKYLIDWLSGLNKT